MLFFCLKKYLKRRRKGCRIRSLFSKYFEEDHVEYRISFEHIVRYKRESRMYLLTQLPKPHAASMKYILSTLKNILIFDDSKI